MLHVETLESRLAPASTLRFTDVEGDRVAVTATRGDLTAAGVATFVPLGAGQQLVRLDLTGAAFQGAAVATVVTRAPGGDGLVNVGRIDATGRDLASVAVKGDLGAIDAGDGNRARPALGLLSVRSMGLHGLATQGGAGDLVSNFNGTLGALRVAGDVREATIDVTDSGGTAGTLGSVVIGGSLVGGAADQSGVLTARDGMGPVTIRGDIVGGAGTTSGSVSPEGDLAALTVGGSIRGGSGLTSGVVFSSLGRVGPVEVGGDIAGGAHFSTGRVFGSSGIASVTVGGSLVGGAANDSGRIHSNSLIGPVRIAGNIIGRTPFTGSIEAHRLAGVTVGGSVVGSAEWSAFVRSGSDIGAVRIGRDLAGGSGLASGVILPAGTLASLTVGGSVLGGDGTSSGAVQSGGTLGRVVIGGSVVAGNGEASGVVFAAGTIASVAIGGSVVGGSGFESGRIYSSNGDLGPVAIGGSVVGGSGFATATVRSGGDLGPVRIGRDLAGGPGLSSGSISSVGDLAGLTVGGSVLGGTANETGTVLAGGNLGPVRIGRDLRGGSIAGTQPALDSTGYITGDRIASVFVGGSIITGTDTSTAGRLTKNASIRAADDLGPVAVRGSLVGNTNPSGFAPVVIAARGQAVVPAGATTDLAIRSLTVGGRVDLALILAGYSPDNIVLNAGSNGNASIGAVTVGGDWVASSLAAGVQDGGPGGFGTAGDAVINNAGDGIVARIASVSIGGVVAGTANPNDHYGFTAQQIGSFRAGAYVAPLTAGTDVIELSPTTGDVTIREV